MSRSSKIVISGRKNFLLASFLHLLIKKIVPRRLQDLGMIKIEKRLADSGIKIQNRKIEAWLWIKLFVDTLSPENEIFIPFNFHYGDLIQYYHYFFLKRKESKNAVLIDFGCKNELEIKKLFFSDDDAGIISKYQKNILNLIDRNTSSTSRRILLRSGLKDMMKLEISSRGMRLDQGDPSNNFEFDGFIAEFKYQPLIDEREAHPIKKEYTRLVADYLEPNKNHCYYHKIDDFINLKNNLQLKEPYICLHIRELSPDKSQPRSVENPGNYKKGVSELIARGYQVVLMGADTNDQALDPYLELKIPGTVSYYKSSYQSVGNDALLIKHSEWLICSCAGVLGYSFLYRKPTLVLNAMYIAFTYLLEEHRYYPKHLFKRSEIEMSPSEYLKTSAVYDQEGTWMKKEGISYKDISENEILEALLEFEQLIANDRLFKHKSELQKRFHELFSKKHFFLNNAKASPLDCYLHQFQQI